VGLISGMPMIRISKKKLNRDKDMGGLFNVKSTAMKGAQIPK
jgi:hypothetical protein